MKDRLFVMFLTIRLLDTLRYNMYLQYWQAYKNNKVVYTFIQTNNKLEDK